ncbi:hypothetical protein [Streptomyces sp. NBC_00069]|uniref:hypothetical protein n=1 Tax=Streptomyces sp. NBC_00069 TaxID=2975639 RepID=UPI00324692F6
MATTNRWHLQGSVDYAYSGQEAGALLHRRLDWATQETWFESDAGQLLAVVTNGERAMVMVLDGEGDPGKHLVYPRGEGFSAGYVLSSGQVDTYADRDTVAFDFAEQAVAHFIEHGTWPPGATFATAPEGGPCGTARRIQGRGN